LTEKPSESKILYQCVRCKRVFEREKISRVAETRCPLCGYNVIRKAKSPMAKLIETSKIGKEATQATS